MISVSLCHLPRSGFDYFFLNPVLVFSEAGRSILLVCHFFIEFRQIENEYGPVEWEIKDPGKAYTKWAAQMAVGLDTGVPWIMCKQEDAPDPVVS